MKNLTWFCIGKMYNKFLHISHILSSTKLKLKFLCKKTRNGGNLPGGIWIIRFFAKRRLILWPLHVALVSGRFAIYSYTYSIYPILGDWNWLPAHGLCQFLHSCIYTRKICRTLGSKTNLIWRSIRLEINKIFYRPKSEHLQEFFGRLEWQTTQNNLQDVVSGSAPTAVYHLHIVPMTDFYKEKKIWKKIT